MSAWRLLMWSIAVLGVGLGAGLWLGGFTVAGVLIAAVAAIALVVMHLVERAAQNREDPRIEAQKIEAVDEDRRNELIRGTSMHLRNMKYRYSIRHDRGDRAAFTTEVNTIILGFVPVIILDNQSEKQGYGYVAFPYDGRRWRGPGLPCGGGPEQAVAHASRCVAPLEEDGADSDS